MWSWLPYKNLQAHRNSTQVACVSKRHNRMQVMEVFQEMVFKGCERSVITYSSLISACEKAGQSDLAHGAVCRRWPRRAASPTPSPTTPSSPPAPKAVRSGSTPPMPPHPPTSLPCSCNGTLQAGCR